MTAENSKPHLALGPRSARFTGGLDDRIRKVMKAVICHEDEVVFAPSDFSDLEELKEFMSIVMTDVVYCAFSSVKYKFDIYDDGDGAFSVSFSYNMDKRELILARKALAAAVDKLASEAEEAHPNDKLLQLSYCTCWLMKHVDVPESLEGLSEAQQDLLHTAYGALVEKKAVCNGLAAAMEQLCRKLGIDCSPTYGHLEDDGQPLSITRQSRELAKDRLGVDDLRDVFSENDLDCNHSWNFVCEIEMPTGEVVSGHLDVMLSRASWRDNGDGTWDYDLLLPNAYIEEKGIRAAKGDILPISNLGRPVVVRMAAR